MRASLKKKQITFWDAFTMFDNSNTGLLSPSEFYGALVFLGVPDITPDDVVDFFDGFDKNRDGIIDYKEYVSILSTLDEEETSADSAQANDERVTSLKVEPHGAEELREIMTKRKQVEITRQKNERSRRQAYKEALDVRIFEEELQASSNRKGGANPVVKEEEIAGLGLVKVSDYHFKLNQMPLRVICNAKASLFHPIFLGTLAAPKIREFVCTHKPDQKKCKRSKKQPLSKCSWYWTTCNVCYKNNVQFYCGTCSSTYCGNCVAADRTSQEKDAINPAKHPTFLRAPPGSLISLQIPSANVSDLVDGKFTISLALRFWCSSVSKEKLLPKLGQSIIRFTASDNSFLSKHAAVTLSGAGVLSAGGDEIHDPVARRLIRVNVWYILSFVVHPNEGSIFCYINGDLCSTSMGLNTKNLTLEHKLIVLGGGKIAQDRGGDVRKMVVHSAALDKEAIKALYFKMADEHEGIGGRGLLIQRVARGYICRRNLKPKPVIVDPEVGVATTVSEDTISSTAVNVASLTSIDEENIETTTESCTVLDASVVEEVTNTTVASTSAILNDTSVE